MAGGSQNAAAGDEKVLGLVRRGGASLSPPGKGKRSTIKKNPKDSMQKKGSAVEERQKKNIRDDRANDAECPVAKQLRGRKRVHGRMRGSEQAV